MPNKLAGSMKLSAVSEAAMTVRRAYLHGGEDRAHKNGANETIEDAHG